MNKYILTLTLLICSCSATQPSPQPQKGQSLYWNILDGLSKELWTKEKIKKLFGEPREIFKNMEQINQDSWIYDHPTEEYQEWTFGFDEKDQLAFVKYFPADDFSSEFSLENLEKHWAQFNCEHKTKQKTQPHVIRNLTYLSCDNGKRYVEYNKYNEVLFITVEK